MRAVVAQPGAPLRMVAVPPPALPLPGWIRVDVQLAGICGSDLRRWGPGSSHGGPADAHQKPSDVDPVAPSRPAVIPGHEIVGRVAAAWDARALDEAGLAPGERVVVDPVLSCVARGLESCAHCARGWHSQCLRQAHPIPATGKGVGFTASLGGGWADDVVAHGTMLHAVPDVVDDQTAILAEPLSVVLSGLGLVAAALPRRPRVAVISAGTLGLLSTLAVATTLSPEILAVVARHPHQAMTATAVGASSAFVAGDDGGFEALRDLVGTTASGSAESAMLWDGYDLVIEAGGSASGLDLGLRAAATAGTVLTLGTPEAERLDLRPLWLKELRLVGAVERRAPEQGAPRTAGAFAWALDLLASAPGIGGLLVTHTLPLDEFEQALNIARQRADHRSTRVALGRLPERVDSRVSP